MRRNAQALAGYAVLMLVLAAALFLPARSWRYWQAWAFLGTFAGGSAAITIYLAWRDPELLARRTRAGALAETRASQKVIQGIAQLAFLALVIIPALEHRHPHVAAVPAWLSIVADGVVALGLLIVFFVFRRNSFASATIEVSAQQRVISDGPYAVVRHPMYSGALALLLAMPLALGSYLGLIAFVPMAAILVWRILDEERYLAASLPGYADYCARVRWRLVPRIW